jgi:hypothetical protein
MMPGYGEQMRAISLRYVPTAVLSRQTAGLRGKSLIINLPGKPKSIRETFDEVRPARVGTGASSRVSLRGAQQHPHQQPVLVLLLTRCKGCASEPVLRIRQLHPIHGCHDP